MALHLHCASATAGRLDEVLIMLSLVHVQKCPALIQRRQRRRHKHCGEGGLFFCYALSRTQLLISCSVFGHRTSCVRACLFRDSAGCSRIYNCNQVQWKTHESKRNAESFKAKEIGMYFYCGRKPCTHNCITFLKMQFIRERAS